MPVFNRGGERVKLFVNTHIGLASVCAVTSAESSNVSCFGVGSAVPSTSTWDSHLADL